MSIKLLTGDLLTAQTDLIMHGVNAQGKMASGVAKAVREKFPLAYTDYIEKFRKDKWKVGDVQFSHTNVDKPRFIVNACTQDYYGYDSKQYVSYKGISDCMTAVLRFADREKYSVAMPKIGAGLGGGDWNVIFNIINKAALAYPDVVVEIYSLAGSEREGKRD